MHQSTESQKIIEIPSLDVKLFSAFILSFISPLLHSSKNATSKFCQSISLSW